MVALEENLVEHTNFMPLETVAFIRHLSECDSVGQFSTTAENDEIAEVNDISSNGSVNNIANTTAVDCAVLSVDCDDDNETLVNGRVTSERYNDGEPASVSSSYDISHSNICIERCRIPCVKILSKNLGAPPIPNC